MTSEPRLLAAVPLGKGNEEADVLFISQEVVRCPGESYLLTLCFLPSSFLQAEQPEAADHLTKACDCRGTCSGEGVRTRMGKS